jgi:hypothetical protein
MACTIFRVNVYFNRRISDRCIADTAEILFDSVPDSD